MKKLLVLQHEVSTPPALTLEWAQERGVSLEIQMVPQIKDWPQAGDYAGIIILGGSMDTWQTEKHPWLLEEKKFLEAALNQGSKIFGICLGCQLLAEIMGGKVVENPQWEIGWLPLQLATASLHFAQYHKYKVTKPLQSQALGISDWCDTQGFTFGQQVIATQFHPEAGLGWYSGKLPPGVSANNKNIQSLELIKQQELLHLQAARTWYFSNLDQLFL